jgi:hypothetical protein
MNSMSYSKVTEVILNLIRQRKILLIITVAILVDIVLHQGSNKKNRSLPGVGFNNQRMVINYGVRVKYNNYKDTTIFYQTEETLLVQNAALLSSFTKQW